MEFWSNGGWSRLLNLSKSGEGHAFSLLQLQKT